MSGKRILGGSQTAHDQSWYDGETYYCAERYSRIKANYVKHHDTNTDFFKKNIYSRMKEYDVLACTIPLNQTFYNYPELVPHLLKCWDFVPEKLFDHYHKGYFFFADHHQSHAVYAYLQSGFEECDILAYDGGAGHFETMWVDKDQNVKDLTKDWMFGKTWLVATSLCGWFADQHTGKVMGMSAYGKVHDGLLEQLYDVMTGKISPLHHAEKVLIKYVVRENITKVDVAATVQYLSERELIKIIKKYKTSDNICVSGGVAYNGYMNELLTKYYDNVFVPPAVGDEGQSIGIYMMADYIINGNIHKPNVYCGQKWDVEESIFEGIDKC